MDTAIITDISTGLVAGAALVVSIVYGRHSMKVATEAATAAAKVARAELGRDHDSYRPDMTDAGSFGFLHEDGRSVSRWVYQFTLPRSYRMHAYAVSGDESRVYVGVSPSNVVEGGRERVIILGDANGALPKLLELRFWPPELGDSGERWVCPCGQPEHQGDQDSEAHWVVSVPVKHPQVPLVAYR